MVKGPSWEGQSPPVQPLHVAVFGSMSPWYEAIAVAAGAVKVTTIEYNKLTYDHPQMETVVPADLVLPEGGFDAAFSISSFDHDGQCSHPQPLRFVPTLADAARGGGRLARPTSTMQTINSSIGPMRFPLFTFHADTCNIADVNTQSID